MKFDIIIIGGGHNGLTAATILSKRGKRVLVLEKNRNWGGLCCSDEFSKGYFSGGVLNDFSTLRPEMIEATSMDHFGFNFSNKMTTTLIPDLKGGAILLSADHEQTAKDLGKYSKSDATNYEKYRAFIKKSSKILKPLLNDPPPHLMPQNIWQNMDLLKKALNLRALGKKEMMEFFRVAPMCAADFVNEYFETEFFKAAIAAPALYHSTTGPWSPGTAANILMYEATSQIHSEEGSHHFIRALEDSAISSGATLQSDSEVEEILVAGNRVTGVRLKGNEIIESEVVLSTVTAQQTFLNMMAPHHLSAQFESEVRSIRSRGTAFKIHLGIKGENPFGPLHPRAKEAKWVRINSSIDDSERAFDATKYRMFSQKPFLEIHIPSLGNDQVAPKGHEVLSIWAYFAPYQLEGGWTEIAKNTFYSNVEKVLKGVIPDIESRITAKELLSPKDLESKFNLTQGHVYHGEHALDQLLERPTALTSHFETPINGLYMGGSACHPGGGITCAPGGFSSNVITKMER